MNACCILGPSESSEAAAGCSQVYIPTRAAVGLFGNPIKESGKIVLYTREI